jgi:DHA1 family bicyclomycin/chloramphenicol resistance-like MFS transporter
MKFSKTLNIWFRQRKGHPTSERNQTSPSYFEFVVVISMMFSLTALTIDGMLPALPQIGTDLGVTNPNERQLVISIIFLGQAFGQLFFGPLSDKTGRKPAIFAGYLLFIAGSLVSVFSVNFNMMLLGRTIQGLGLSAPRGVSMALVRDRHEGRQMARVMSFATTILILVPMIAPTLGQLILSFAGWRSIFSGFVLFAVVTLIWYGLRIPETLPVEKRRSFNFKKVLNSTMEILGLRPSLGFTLTAGLISGAFLGYLNSSQQIFQEMYALGNRFPIYFATISLSLGLASFLNTRLVLRYGMIQLAKSALAFIFALGVLYLGFAVLLGGRPPLFSLMAYLMMTFFCIGIMFGNMNALAMQPLGHLAGIGAAVVGSVSTLISMLLGILIGQSYNGTILPLVVGITILSGVSIFIIRWAASERLAEGAI